MQIAASPGQVYRAVQEVTLGEIPLAGLLFWVRALPARLSGRRLLAFHPGRSLLDQAVAPEGGFLLLGEAPDRELVVGTVGQFWKIQGGLVPGLADRQDFLTFLDPRFAKAVLGFLIEGAPGNLTRLTTETRVAVLLPPARRRFALYWVIIRPWSGLLRRLWLGAIKRRAERGG